MKPSLNGTILGGGLSAMEQFELASKVGLPGVDTGIEAIAAMVEEKSIDGVKEYFAELNVQPGVWGLSVNWREDEDTFKTGLANLPAQAKLGQEIGCPRTCTWIPPTTEDPAAFRKIAVRRFAECGRILGEHGVRLGLEWVGPATSRGNNPDFIHRMDQLLEMEEEMAEPNIGLLVDSFHWFTAGHTQAELEALPVEKVVHVHLNDATADRTAEEQLDMERLLPGEGQIDLRAFLGALKRIGYEDYMGIETFSAELTQLPPEESALRAKKAADSVLALI